MKFRQEDEMTPLCRRKFLYQLGGTTAASFAGSGLPSPIFGGRAARQKKIRIGQIGVGHAHAKKLEIYRRSPDYEVVGVVEEDAKLRKREQMWPAYHDLPWMTQEQLLNVPGLDAVMVETRVRNLLDVAEVCIRAGKHIHIDKPAGQSLKQFRRILDEASKRQLFVQLGYMYRYNPAIVMLRDFLQKGWIGTPFEVHTVMSKVVGRESRRQLAEYPGGMMFELGCHLVDLVVSILGKPAAVIPFAQHSSSIKDGLVDNMLAVFKYEGMTASIKSTAMEVEGFARRHLVLCGDEGTFHVQPLDSPSVRLALSKSRGIYQKGYQEIRFPKYTRFVDDAADMVRILRGEKSTDFPYEHDFTVQETLLKACGLPLV